MQQQQQEQQQLDQQQPQHQQQQQQQPPPDPEIRQVLDPVELPCKWVDGFRYPFFSRVENFARFKDEAEFEAGDVVLLSYPKTGNHWATGYLGMLMTGAEEIPEFELGLMEGQFDVEKVRDRPHPRIFLSHIPYRDLPKGLTENKDVKIVILIRNPKDTAVSYFHFIKKWTHGNVQFTGDFESFSRRYLDGQIVYGTWFDYYVPLFQNLVGRPNVHVVQFESLKMDFLGTLYNLANFMGIETTEDRLRTIREKTTFGQMSQWAATVQTKGRAMSDFYRKGIVGDWRSIMDERTSEEIDGRMERLKDVFKGCYNDVS